MMLAEAVPATAVVVAAKAVATTSLRIRDATARPNTTEVDNSFRMRPSLFSHMKIYWIARRRNCQKGVGYVIFKSSATPSS